MLDVCAFLSSDPKVQALLTTTPSQKNVHRSQAQTNSSGLCGSALCFKFSKSESPQARSRVSHGRVGATLIPYPLHVRICFFRQLFQRVLLNDHVDLFVQEVFCALLANCIPANPSCDYNRDREAHFTPDASTWRACVHSHGGLP